MVNPENGSELLSVGQIAEYLGMAERTIFLWAQQNKLPAFKLGTTWRFRRSDIDGWLETQRSGPEIPSNESRSITNPLTPPSTIKQQNNESIIEKEALIEACISYIYSLMEEQERSIWIVEQFEQRFGMDCAKEAVKRLVKKKEVSLKDVTDLNGRKVKAINRR